MEGWKVKWKLVQCGEAKIEWSDAIEVERIRFIGRVKNVKRSGMMTHLTHWKTAK